MKPSLLLNRMYATQQKPLEIYLFVDPLCPECWTLEPLIRKLHIEYGRYFRLKKVLTGSLAALNLSERNGRKWETATARNGIAGDGPFWMDHLVSSPFLASVAIKAAELQGRRAGGRFLRKLQEFLFVERQNISDLAVLADCAEKASLDKAEFLNDIYSSSAAKAFQCDLKIAAEMEVDETPTLVFFNENIDEEGIKITGVYSYDIYVQIIEEMLEEIPEPQQPPSLEEFLKQFRFTATKEISLVYNWTEREVEREMKKLLLQRKVRKVPMKSGSIWEFVAQ